MALRGASVWAGFDAKFRAAWVKGLIGRNDPAQRALDEESARRIAVSLRVRIA